MKLGRGVAANEALCENLFVLMISVLNSIPVFIVGKPGSSKSLAVSVLRANLNGRASATTFLRTFPAVEIFSHQCSPQSTSQGILQVKAHLAWSIHSDVTVRCGFGAFLSRGVLLQGAQDRRLD